MILYFKYLSSQLLAGGASLLIATWLRRWLSGRQTRKDCQLSSRSKCIFVKASQHSKKGNGEISPFPERDNSLYTRVLDGKQYQGIVVPWYWQLQLGFDTLLYFYAFILLYFYTFTSLHFHTVTKADSWTAIGRFKIRVPRGLTIHHQQEGD